jgi:P27 family predicted phage terminase small subunit
MAGVGRRGKPNALKRLEGNRSRRPIANEVKPVEGALLPPFCMDELQREIFRRTIASMPPGVYTPADAGMIALHAIAQCYLERAAHSLNSDGLVVCGPDGKPARNPHVSIFARMAEIVRRTSVELGLTPVARNRIVVPKDTSDDPLELLLAYGPNEHRQRGLVCGPAVGVGQGT